MIAADDAVVGRVAGMQDEAAGRLGHQRLDQRGVEAHAAAAILEHRAALAQDLARLGQQEVDADVAQDLERRLVDRLDLVGRQDLDRPVEQPDWLARQLDDPARPMVAGALSRRGSSPGSHGSVPAPQADVLKRSSAATSWARMPGSIAE